MIIEYSFSTNGTSKAEEDEIESRHGSPQMINLSPHESPIETFKSSIRELNGASEGSTRQNSQMIHGLEFNHEQSRYFQHLNSGIPLSIPSSLAIGNVHNKSLESHLLTSRYCYFTKREICFNKYHTIKFCHLK